ncbi:MAG: nucleotide exchange factor GrpE [Promethearchaeota archaeon]|nr:MAG: nucleotide exchange factor GrpE [Candidatus Lokiarchaeota archaeon]
MTKEKEEKKPKSKSEQINKSESIEEDKKDKESKQETEKKASELNSDQKVELLEEKEGAGLQLEYFSKDDLIKQLKELKEDLKSRDEKIKELEPWKDKYMRLQAEFENTQKRWDKNRQYLKAQYTAAVLKDFLPLYDSFKKAIESSPEKDQLKQFYNQFMNILKFEGATPMETKINDPYDYNLHEAITSVEKKDIEENRILDIIQEGWKFDKDVLRYAKVVISKKPKPPEPEPESKIEKEAEGQAQSQEDTQKKNKEDSPDEDKKKDSNSSENNYIS